MKKSFKSRGRSFFFYFKNLLFYFLKNLSTPPHLLLKCKFLFFHKLSFLLKNNKLSYLNQKGSALVSVVIASAIGAIVILGVGTSIMQQSTSQKKIKDSNTELWKVIQIQSLLNKFANEDDSTNTDDNKKCLKVLNDNIKTKPSGFEFVSRDCTATTDPELPECATTTPASERPKIIHLKGTGTTPTNPPTDWDFKISVKDSQCCSLFYEEIIDKADGKSGLPTNIQTQIDALPATTHATRKTKVEEVVELIIADTTPLTYAKDVCGDVVVGGGGGSGDPDCYKVTESPSELSLVGCGDTTEVSVNHHTAFGFEAGKSTTGSGAGNTFVGYKAGRANISDSNNTFVGYQAGTNTTGENNTYIGYATVSAFSSLGTGNHKNTIIGSQAGHRLRQGSNNVFIGFEAGKLELNRHNNTYVGAYAGGGGQSGHGGNTYIGHGAGYGDGTFMGSKNTFVGFQAGTKSNYSSGRNVFIGYESGKRNTTGSSNIFIGTQTGTHGSSWGNTTGSNNIYIGDHAGKSYNTSNNIVIGNNLQPNSGGKRLNIGNIIMGNMDKNHKEILINHSNLRVGNVNYTGGGSDGGTLIVDRELRIGGRNQNNGYGQGRFTVSNGISSSINRDVTIDNGMLSAYDVTIRRDLIVEGNLRVKKSSPSSSTDYFTLNTSGASASFGSPAAPLSPSDRRLKTKIKDLKNQTHSLLKLNPKTFYWKDKHRVQTKQIGLIAQEVQKEYPELVSEGSDPKKTLSLNYQGLIPVIIKAFKEFYNSTTKTLNFLKESVSALTKSLSDLKETFQTEFLTFKKELGANQSQIEETKIKLKQTSDDVKATTKEITKLKQTQLQTEKKLASTNKKLERELTSLKKENTSLKENLNSLIKRVDRLERLSTKL